MVRFAEERFYTCSGDTVIPAYAPKVQPDGSIVIVENGKEDLNAFIQSFKESTDIAFILAKLANGDTSVLHQRPVFYGDFTEVPSTYAEMLQLQIDAGRAFDRLPVEVKQKFDNDVNKFMASAGSEEWFSKLDKFIEKPVVDNPVVEKESVEE